MPRESEATRRRPRYKWLRHGRPGNAQTLFEMAAMVRRDVERDHALRDFANEILLRAGARGDVRRRSMDEVEALFRFVQYKSEEDRGVIFRRDSFGGDAIKDARETLRDGIGDSDDIAVLLATLLGSVGHLTRFIVIRVNPASGKAFDHVYLEVLHPDGDRWVALDATNEQALVGWEEPRVLERRTYKIFSEDPEGNDLAGFLSVLKKIGQVALPVAATFPIPGVSPERAAQIQQAAGIGAGLLANVGAGGGGGGDKKAEGAAVEAAGIAMRDQLTALQQRMAGGDVPPARVQAELEEIAAQYAALGSQLRTSGAGAKFQEYGQMLAARAQIIVSDAPRLYRGSPGGVEVNTGGLALAGVGGLLVLGLLFGRR